MSYAIDTHCHLTFVPKRSRKAVVERALKANVRKMITVACNLEETANCISVADEYDLVWATAGIHPTDLGKNIERELECVYKYAKNEPKIVAIGEIGLDFYHDKYPRDLQAAYFEGQLNIAKQLKKPAILHCRAGKFAGENTSVFPDMLKILKKTDTKNAVMHCFSGSYDEGIRFLNHGLMISFTGIITYDRNEDLRRLIKDIPMASIMIETDSPFLPPAKYRGKKNEPAYIIETAKTIADVRGMDPDEVLRATSDNAEKFFGI